MLVSSSFYTCTPCGSTSVPPPTAFVPPKSYTLIPTLPWGTIRALDSVLFLDLLPKLLNWWLYPASSHKDCVLFSQSALPLLIFFHKIKVFWIQITASDTYLWKDGADPSRKASHFQSPVHRGESGCFHSWEGCLPHPCLPAAFHQVLASWWNGSPSAQAHSSNDWPESLPNATCGGEAGG